LLDEKRRLVYEGDPDYYQLKVHRIQFTIKDKNRFAEQLFSPDTDLGSVFAKMNSYQPYDKTKVNEVIYPSSEYKYSRQKLCFRRHYSLAFQGGGAKGLAYVGAYRALLEQRQRSKLEVKNIIGSSAGGIIALAVSTGIPDYEIQKVCYKMSNIPKNDRF
jgi:hypothetical protein